MQRLSWFPFTAGEVELTLAVAGLGATAASLLGVPGTWVVAGTAGTLFALLFAGLLASAAGDRVTRVHLDGALRGRGYKRIFQQVKRSLLLIHIDDDVPDDELLGLYRTLLARGVEIRRLVFVRPDHDPDGIQWIVEFGSHEHLRQRIVVAKPCAPLMMSFSAGESRPAFKNSKRIA